MSKLSLILGFLGGIIVVIGVVTYLSYQSDISTARERVLAGSKVIETASGPIEYADIGDGYPVLVVHGAGGGYDQGVILSKVLLNDDFRVIAPSRFGFLRTPLPDNASFAAQADVFADLLDELNISRVAVVGISAGGPSTLQFALRYPERISSMVLVSAVVHKEKPMDFRDKIIHNVIFKSDFIFWLITKYFESGLISFFGVTPEVQAKLTPEEKYWLSDILIPSMHPISQRQAGMVNDRTNFPFLDYPLDQITVPTLVVYARDDTLVNPSHSQYAAQKIPDAKVITLKSGGHILMGQHERVGPEIVKFLNQHAANTQPSKGE
ncbi:putative hydrolase or acyltransferase of alpha/beta superfamily [Candidatus Methanoperedens nitroreducens]|uniref:Putative hydrolase or acyltransferase of alpha/beta superfamily n=1 Tax=Candidatus Methanoperedens nitratireducens TaxID=1392998 RepID=A0A062V5M2_9EURY|nr:alpha/beta hydrolase [Candidatus Methanoperedens nitroreducens]KCZ71099.1 putative hydrolase or acyltransferase of alpha/beta superfamily [Candidatus Methanoperedens nitroreducens]MDJ1421525.1 alpha/beta hydrolase [Candidatus Methanoperedens sp.]